VEDGDAGIGKHGSLLRLGPGWRFPGQVTDDRFGSTDSG